MNKRLTLLNFEGDVLYTVRNGKNEFEVFDQWNQSLGEFTRGELIDVYDGWIDIEDSKGKLWDVSKEHSDAKPTMSDLLEFIFE